MRRERLKPSVRRLYDRFYPAASYVDENALLDREVTALLTPDAVLLDAGAGAGEIYPYDYRDRCREVIGVDLDPRVATSRRLTRGIIGSLEALPLPDCSVDVVMSRYVFEHLTNVPQVVSEIHRVLRPGGSAVILTPSRWHYVTLGARWTPHWFHEVYNRWRGRSEEDTFPTTYPANTGPALSRVFESSGLETERIIRREMAPNYLVLAAPLFVAGVAYERLVNRYSVLAPLRIVLIGRFRKPD
jgi:SAM-dependent methyltransferase